jgi:hypothetical protein
VPRAREARWVRPCGRGRMWWILPACFGIAISPINNGPAANYSIKRKNSRSSNDTQPDRIKGSGKDCPWDHALCLPCRSRTRWKTIFGLQLVARSALLALGCRCAPGRRDVPMGNACHQCDRIVHHWILRGAHRSRWTGVYTTFSSFSLQTLNLMNDGEWANAGANIGLSVVLCLIAVWAGVMLASIVNAMEWI